MLHEPYSFGKLIGRHFNVGKVAKFELIIFLKFILATKLDI